MDEELEAIETVTDVINRIQRYGRNAHLTLSNGIILECKTVPPLLVSAVDQEFVPPPPPKWFDPEKQREEDNPNDPDYLKEVQKLEDARQLALTDLTLAVGTKVFFIPEGYYPPESDEWIASVEFANRITGRDLKVDKDDPTKRYLSWLRFYALETGVDVALASSLPYQLAGVSEQEVSDAIASFRRLQERGTNSDPAPAAVSANGNRPNRASRRSR